MVASTFKEAFSEEWVKEHITDFWEGVFGNLCRAGVIKNDAQLTDSTVMGLGIFRVHVENC